MAELATPAVELIGIDKWFGPVHANRTVNLRISKGSIHGIVGENGAGKSTLMHILYGYHRADAGEIRVDGKPVRIHHPADALGHGIGMVHQHFMLVEPFTVLENVLLGAEAGRSSPTASPRRASSLRIWRASTAWMSTRKRGWATFRSACSSGSRS